MKLEKVLPHLRAGGQVTIINYDNKVRTYNNIYHIQDLPNFLLRDDYEIVKEPYKKEHIVSFHDEYGYSVDGDCFKSISDMFTFINGNENYKVTIEEI